MFPCSLLCMVFPLLVGYMIEHYYLHLQLARALFLFNIKLILFVCKVGRTWEIKLLNFYPDQCQMRPISCHNTDITCLTLNHNLYL